MPSVKIPRKSTDFDMTPFVDVAFLILTFFILATKFKPPERIEVKTPKSVSADKLKEQDGMIVSFDSAGKVFLNITVLKGENRDPLYSEIISSVNAAKQLGLTDAEKQAFKNEPIIGVPFSRLKAHLGGQKVPETGIPVDSTNNELAQWVASANDAFRSHPEMKLELNYLIKGDNNASFPSFKGVIDAFRINEVFKFQLVTDPRSVPPGTELYKNPKKAAE
jgi:biopolymer transport protein ExbD